MRSLSLGRDYGFPSDDIWAQSRVLFQNISTSIFLLFPTFNFLVTRRSFSLTPG